MSVQRVILQLAETQKVDQWRSYRFYVANIDFIFVIVDYVQFRDTSITSIHITVNYEPYSYTDCKVVKAVKIALQNNLVTKSQKYRLWCNKINYVPMWNIFLI